MSDTEKNIADSYQYKEAKRLNLPSAGKAADGKVKEVPKHRLDYDPHLPPALRFDPTGQDDGLRANIERLMAEAQSRPLKPEEANLIVSAVQNRQPWLEWAGKKEAQKAPREVEPVTLHVHERVSTQAILKVAARQDVARNLFADPELEYREAVQFYQHEVAWANRLILGDSLQVMTSLAHREDLTGKVQMIYMDPPYGIKFASNFQTEVGKRQVTDKEIDLTREPETVKAYRDTWTLGVHSYLAYLRDRLIAAKELLAESGSIFVQIGDENVHRIRMVLEEIFGADNFCAEIAFVKTSGLTSGLLADRYDVLLWFAKEIKQVKYRQLYTEKSLEEGTAGNYGWLEFSNGFRRGMTKVEKEQPDLIPIDAVIYKPDNITSQGNPVKPFLYQGKVYDKPWKTNEQGRQRLALAGRFHSAADSLQYVRYLSDFVCLPVTKLWTDTATGSFTDDKLYVVQTGTKTVARCILMTTDPGDLVLDPTCGSGTTAYVAEQWGRRWITIDASRVALSIARQRLLTAKYDYYTLQDEEKGVSGNFVYKTVPHITLKSIAQNQALDPIFAEWEPKLDAALASCNLELT